MRQTSSNLRQSVQKCAYLAKTEGFATLGREGNVMQMSPDSEVAFPLRDIHSMNISCDWNH